MLYHNEVKRTYYCPKCKCVLKRENENYGNDGCVIFFAIIAFLPLWLIYKGINLLVEKYSKKEPSITYVGTNILGENIFRCNKCKSMVAFNMMGTRLVTEDELL